MKDGAKSPTNDRRLQRAAGILLAAAAAVFALSVLLPYWHLKVVAPQYPKGLTVEIFVDRVTGDIQEIDTLNHYIGMRPLAEAARFERKFAMVGIGGLILATLIYIPFRRRWAVLLALPALLFPAVFAGDLYFWLRDFGLHLNPKAPLSSSVKPFIPPLFGHGKIAQFNAFAHFAGGFWLSALGAVLVAVAAWLKFRSGRPPKGGTFKAVLCALALSGIAVPAPAATWTVGAGGEPTIRQAIEKAASGDEIRVAGGVHAGPLTIDKSLSLIGEGQPTLDGLNSGTVITVKADDVLIKGFRIVRSGDALSRDEGGIVATGRGIRIEDNELRDVLFGVYFKQAPEAALRRNTLVGKDLPVSRRGDLIRTWHSDRTIIEDNRMEHGRDAVLWFSKDLIVRRNRFAHSRYGLHFMYCDGAEIEENRLEHNSVGAYLMFSRDLTLRRNKIRGNRGPSGYGIGFKDMNGPVIEANTVVQNRVGLFFDGCADGRYAGNLVAFNDIGAQLFPSVRQNTFTRNSFIDNAEQVMTDGASGRTVNDWRQNYWSDYRGYDADGDGVGDIPYEPLKLFERLTDRFRALKIFFQSPSVGAIDMAALTFPVFRPVSKFTDPSPLMRPAELPPGNGATGSAPWAWAAAGALCLGPLLGFFKQRIEPVNRLRQSSGAVLPTEGPVIRLRSVSKRYGKVQALSSVDFTISRGESVALWGPNGAGKTTLLRCLLGVIAFDGEARVAGFDVKKQGRDSRRRIGYVPQEIRLHQDQTVWETVSFYARLRDVPRERVERLITEWGLGPARHQMAQNLSGGMKQKLALIIALLSDPPILFFDEPTANLDIRARGEFAAILAALKAAGKTLLFCTHRVSEMRRLADRVVVLESGIKKYDGPPRQMI